MGILNPAYVNYLPAVNQASQTYGVPVNILLSIGQQESSWNINVPTGGAGEVGVMQLTPAIVQQFGVSNPSDPTQNIDGAAAYLATLYQQYGNWPSAVSHYNGSGPAAANYSNQVMARANQLGGIGGAAPSSSATGAVSSNNPGAAGFDITNPNTWAAAVADIADAPAGFITGLFGGNTASPSNGPATNAGAAAGAATGAAVSSANPLNNIDWTLIAGIGVAAIVGVLALSMVFKPSSGSKTTIMPIPI